MRIVSTKSGKTEEALRKAWELKGKIRLRKNRKNFLMKVAIWVGIGNLIVSTLILLQWMGVLHTWLQKIW